MPLGTERSQKAALRAALDFEKVLQSKGVVFEKLDDWMTAFAKFTLSVPALFDTPEERHLALSQRKELCEKAEVDMRQWSPATLKTLVNALALMYKQTAPGHGIVPSATIQFPTFCKFFNAAFKRDRNATARKEPVQVLQDSEVAELFELAILV